MLDKIFAILTTIVLLIFSIFLGCGCSQPTATGGGNQKTKNTLTPQDLIKAKTIEIEMKQSSGDWQTMQLPPNQLHLSQLEFPTQLRLDGTIYRQWVPYNNIFRAGPDAIAGQTTWLMTPFLRHWQIKNIGDWLLKHAETKPRIFDIGIGTGRSRDLWQLVGATRVCGVEPNANNVAELLNKHLPYLGPILTTGGEDLGAIKQNFQQHSFDIVMMSYSLTFFRGPSLKKLYQVVDYLLKPGGVFVGLGMDGNIVNSWIPSSKSKTKSLDTPVFHIKYLADQDIEITMKNAFTLVKSQHEHLIDFDKFLEPWNSWKVEKRENIKPPTYLQDWAAKFVSAQQLFILRRPN